MHRNRVFGAAKSVLFIEVSSFQCVLIKGFHCIANVTQYESHLLHTGKLFHASVMQNMLPQHQLPLSSYH